MSPSWLKVALVALGVSVVPVYAFADSASDASDAAPLAQGADKEKGKHFPMTGAKFMEKVDRRIAKVKERVAARMAKRNVPAEERKAIMADVDAGAVKVRAAAQQVARDGTVTADEAKTVRAVAKEVRKDVREKHGKDTRGKDKKAKKGKKGKADA